MKNQVERIIAGIEKKAQEAKEGGDMETFKVKMETLKQIYAVAKGALVRNNIEPF